MPPIDHPWIIAGQGTCALEFLEEVGELAEALRGNAPKAETAAEFADVLAWLATLANIAGIDLTQAIKDK